LRASPVKLPFPAVATEVTNPKYLNVFADLILKIL